MAERLRARPPRVRGRRERGQEPVVEEVCERPVAHVVEQPGDPERLHHQPLGRDRLARRQRGQRRPQRRVQRAAPQPRLVHDPQAVGEPGVLGRREHPARALELRDPAQPLEPGRVEQVVLGDVLVGVAGGARLGGGQPLGELDVAVDRVGDEVDGREREPAAGSRAAGRGPRIRYGTQIRVVLVHGESVPRASRARTRNRYQWPRTRLGRVSAVARVLSRIVRQVRSSRRKRTSKSRRPAVWVWSRGSDAGPAERHVRVDRAPGR